MKRLIIKIDSMDQVFQIFVNIYQLHKKTSNLKYPSERILKKKILSSRRRKKISRER